MAVLKTIENLKLCNAPAPEKWMVDRLSALMIQFSVSRQPRAVEDLALWMSETMRMLSDLPHDILAHSMDQAVKSARHGFMPSVGEIRAIADPLHDERKKQVERLERIATAMEVKAA